MAGLGVAASGAALLLLFGRGASLVNRELRQQGIEGEVTATPNADQIAVLASLLLVRIANDVQARAVGSAVRAQTTSQVTGDDAGDIGATVRDDYPDGVGVCSWAG